VRAGPGVAKGAPLSDNPPRPLLALPFPGVVPAHGGGFAFRPGHHHRITLAR